MTIERTPKNGESPENFGQQTMEPDPQALEPQARVEILTRNGKLRVLFTLLAFRMLVAFFVVAWGSYSILSLHPGRPFAELAFLTSAGVFLIVAGAFGYIRCSWDFAVTALSFSPSFVVARGIYSRLRHPMYFSLILVLLGETLLFKSWRMLGYTPAANTDVHALVVFHEEPQMKKKWGAAYLQYCQRVPRWIPSGPRPR